MSSPPPRESIPVLSELPLVLKTRRLTLRPQLESDAEPIFRYASDPVVTPYVTWSAHTEIGETRTWIEKGREGLAKGTDMVWTIEHAGEPIGAIGLHGIIWAVRAVRWDRAEVGYWLGAPHWRQGFMTEAVQAVVPWAFETLGLHKLTIRHIDGNLGSQRVIEKIGFRFLCKNEEDTWRDGRWLAHRVYELTIGEWSDTTRTLRFTRPA